MNGSVNPVRIVVGVDGSQASLAALREAVRLAELLGAAVEAVAAWEPPAKPSSYQARGIGSFEEGARRVLDQALADAFGPVLPQALSARTERGGAAAVLADASRGARYLVVGRRGHGGIMGTLLGSVSAQSINQADCPVIVVR
ncbi:nucleotide-binding universal stress UspA family protein [Arthrobacter silviterrae]|uniref:universal stress protein n=1 Tax=Arthrobacter silviterrae TaxID=2026658 RepID=UPI002782F5E0|nr:universal stress protein [Arthrobacter silviterrae]MDQ0276061.1 nucleotide-binding universal stress UspA family protein [Arthrobacter silviterrae]